MSKLALGTRAVSTSLRALEFAISALVLGIFSYYLAVLSRRSGHSSIPRWEQAVEGMSGAAVIYTAFAVILTCFLGGITFFALVAVFLDILFCACFVAIAVLARDGRKSCGTINNSPIGPGERLSCQLQRVTFIVAIINAVLFLISAGLQILLSRAHKREKRYGPSPANNYTSGYGKQRFWQRKNNKNKSKHHDEELAGVGAGALIAEEKHHHNNNRNSMRPSDDTAVTGTTAPVVAEGYGPKTDGYGQGYGNQTTGVVRSGTVPEIDSGAGRTGGGNYVQHDPAPYAEVHHGGYAHANPESKTYGRDV